MFPTITTTALYPHCGGEGVVTTETATFDTHAEQWYPHTSARPCSHCGGQGAEEVITCRICGLDERECTCAEDDLDNYHALEVAA